MKKPSSNELLGVQSPEDALLLKKEYPEWCAAENKYRVTSDGQTYKDREDAAKFNKVEIFIIVIPIFFFIYLVLL